MPSVSVPAVYMHFDAVIVQVHVVAVPHACQSAHSRVR